MSQNTHTARPSFLTKSTHRRHWKGFFSSQDSVISIQRRRSAAPLSFHPHIVIILSASHSRNTLHGTDLASTCETQTGNFFPSRKTGIIFFTDTPTHRHFLCSSSARFTLVRKVGTSAFFSHTSFAHNVIYRHRRRRR